MFAKRLKDSISRADMRTRGNHTSVGYQMVNIVSDREREFWNKQAGKRNYVNWRDIFPEYLRSPYYAYLSKFPKRVGRNFKILELCCGMGEFSFDIAEITGGTVLATDISDKSIEICRQQLSRHPNENLSFEVADAETLELPENNFDIICMSGSLSCVDTDVILRKIEKFLKTEGTFICVDTYGHNPFFNVKRRINCLLGTRTRQTVKNIPRQSTIERISRCFEETEVDFFGIFAFTSPFLKPLIGDQKTAWFVNFLDRKFSFFKKYAFKFVLAGKKVKTQEGGR